MTCICVCGQNVDAQNYDLGAKQHFCGIPMPRQYLAYTTNNKN